MQVCGCLLSDVGGIPKKREAWLQSGFLRKGREPCSDGEPFRGGSFNVHYNDGLTILTAKPRMQHFRSTSAGSAANIYSEFIHSATMVLSISIAHFLCIKIFIWFCCDDIDHYIHSFHRWVSRIDFRIVFIQELDQTA